MQYYMTHRLLTINESIVIRIVFIIFVIFSFQVFRQISPVSDL